MTIYDLKPTFQNLLRPICRSLAKAGVSANQVTVAALLLSLIVGALVWTFKGAAWTLYMVPVVLFVRMALNAIDGMLAREHDMKSALGAILNELADVVSDTALYLPFAVIPFAPTTLVVLAVILAILTEMAGVVAVQIGAERRYDGPMGKSDRAFVFGLIALLLAFGVPAGGWLSIVFGVVVILLGLTIVNRVRRALEEVTP